jgi:hypothetical protein
MLKLFFKDEDFTNTIRNTYASCIFSGNFVVYESSLSDPITTSPLPFLPGKRKGMVE